MKKLAPALNAAFVPGMEEQAVPLQLRSDYLRWLRFYLDFCFRYRHPPRDGDSLAPWLQKLASKGPSPGRRQMPCGS